MNQTIGILLAAGRGRRMGTTKQLLPWRDDSGETTVIASAFDCVASFCQRMIVVVGHEERSVSDALGKRTFELVRSDPDAEMIDSIRAGFSQACLHEDVALVVLQPADHPQVAASTMRLLLETHESLPDAAVMPEYAGKGGHPALIPISLVDSILAFDGQGGLRAFWETHRNDTVRVPVDDATVVADVDTPEAYERLRANWASEDH